MESGDLAEFVKKRISDHDFPPPLYGFTMFTSLVVLCAVKRN